MRVLLCWVGGWEESGWTLRTQLVLRALFLLPALPGDWQGLGGGAGGL